MGYKKRRFLSKIKSSREDAKKGPLREIWENFFKPLLEDNNVFKDEDESKTYFLDLIFSQREIFIRRAKKTFKCPGGYLEAPYVPNFGHFNNVIDKNSRVLIRSDETQSFVDVETQDERVFRMSKRQYKEIERHFAKEH